jgi:hypothetical protein
VLVSELHVVPAANSKETAMSLDRLVTSSTEPASGWPAVPGASGNACARFDQLWEPDSRAVHKLAIEKFRERVNKKFDLKLEDYDDLYKWSIEELESFWGEVWSFTQPVVSKSYDKVLAAGGHHMDDIPKWFTGCELNFAENLLKFRDFRPALYSIVEGQKTPLVITFAQLYEQVRDVASALRRHGLKKGDRVAGYLPNSSDAVAIMLAVTSIGAVWSSASPDFGVSGVLSRFKQVEPRFLFSVEAVKYHGTVHDNLEKTAGSYPAIVLRRKDHRRSFPVSKPGNRLEHRSKCSFHARLHQRSRQ